MNYNELQPEWDIYWDAINNLSNTAEEIKASIGNMVLRPGDDKFEQLRKAEAVYEAARQNLIKAGYDPLQIP